MGRGRQEGRLAGLGMACRSRQIIRIRRVHQQFPILRARAYFGEPRRDLAKAAVQWGADILQLLLLTNCGGTWLLHDIEYVN